jgi:hypothetical protein
LILEVRSADCSTSGILEKGVKSMLEFILLALFLLSGGITGVILSPRAIGEEVPDAIASNLRGGDDCKTGGELKCDKDFPKKNCTLGTMKSPCGKNSIVVFSKEDGDYKPNKLVCCGFVMAGKDMCQGTKYDLQMPCGTAP